MRLLSKRLAVSAAIIHVLALPSLVQAAAVHKAPNQELTGSQKAFSIAFKDADVTQVIDEVLGQDLGLPYVVDPAISGKISFRIDGHLTKAQLLEAFETTLSANNIALVKDGATISVVPRAKAKGITAVRAPGSGVAVAGYEVVASPLSFAVPTEVAKALESMTGSAAVLYSNDKLGLIILGGSASELKTPLETIKALDQAASRGSRVKWYALKKANATTIATELERLLTATNMPSVTVVPVPRLNGIIVTARSTEAQELVDGWVTRLDADDENAPTSLWVYHPHNTSAEALARTLNSVLGTSGGGSDASSAPATEGTKSSGKPTEVAPVPARATAMASGEDAVRVGVDKDTNSLLIHAPAAQRPQIQRILDEIDKRPSQILIEASILEVTLTQDTQFGVDWSVLNDGGKLNVRSVNNATGVVAPSASGFSLTYLSGNIQAAITALKSKTNVEVVSAPKIVSLDNHTAKLQVGDQVPIVTQSAQSTLTPNTALVNTVEYRDTGIILDVTPRVSGDDRVVVDVSQEVSSVAKTITSGIDSPTIQKRKFESTLVLKSGSIVALGGLISASNTNSHSGTPGLMDLPFVGGLFRSNQKDRTRTELIVLLSAKIIRDDEDSSQVLDKVTDKMHEIKSRDAIKAAG